MKAYKMMFLTTLLSSTIMVLSSYSWLGMWMGLEINLLSMIPIMNEKESLSSEASIKYFITQALASSTIMMAIIMMMVKIQMTMFPTKMTLIAILNSALLTKMGAAPFHFWFPEVMEGLSWMNCFLMSTWQKIAPMVLIMYSMNSMLFMATIIMTSMVVSAMMSFNQTSLRKIMAYSSINHLGWMLSTLMFTETIWMIYLLTYTLMTMTVMIMFKNMNVSTFKQLTQKLNSSMTNKLMFMVNFLNLSGIPPFLGFYPKWMTIQLLISNKMMTLTTLMIVSTVAMIFIYFRIMATALMMKINELSWLPTEKAISSISISMINFVSVSSLILVSLSFSWN